MFVQGVKMSDKGVGECFLFYMCLNRSVCFNPTQSLHWVAPGLLCGSDQEHVHGAVSDMSCSHLRIRFCGGDELHNCARRS